MRPRVLYSARDFVQRLKHVPASIGKEQDGVVLIQFKKFHDWDPYLEFGTDINPDKGGQYFFYEQCNFGTLESGDEYVPGTFFPLSDKKSSS